MKPVIFGCAGPALTERERIFFQKEQPAGFILFARNVENKKQLASLVADLKKSVGRHKVPILIDQEGGRVQRLGEPHWRKYPPMKVFGDMALSNPTLAASALRLNCKLIADDLRRVGINVDCLPLLDVPKQEADPIIGDRAFSGDPALVSALGRIVVDALQEGGVLPVIKHMPGHGRASVDSHLELPIVDTPLSVLEKTDFVPFQALKDAPFAMTAHVTFSSIDAEQPATLSRLLIARVVRMKIGFSGLLLTDDLSMKALKGDLGRLAVASLEAGCDIVLHCNGEIGEMQSIAGALRMDDNGLEKRVVKLIRAVEGVPVPDRGDLIKRYEDLMAKF